MAESTIRILLVEDDEDDFILTRGMLGEIPQRHFELQWVRHYDDAIPLLAGCEYDVALVDYRLGPRDGVQLIRHTRAQGCRQPIILLTGEADLEVDLAATSAGASDFLSKADVTPVMLDRAIRYSMQNAKLEEQRVRLLAERAARSEAEAGSRAKDQFLATLSHELRTPLTPVLVAISAMSGDPHLSPEIRQDVEMIRRNIELEAKLIDDLLDLTRITRGKLELRSAPVDLHEKLGQVLQICDIEAKAKQLQIVVNRNAANSQIQGDSARLQQILWNLIKNAVKFTPAQGAITITTANEAAANGLEHVVITVADTGIGIAPEMLPRIFDAFEQGGREVTRAHGGLGLGLTISKALADLHGGGLSASSDGRGKGAAFTLRLPVHRKSAAPALRAAGGSGSDSTARHRVLFVEDHIDTAKALSRVLTHSGYDVHHADSVAGAKLAIDSERFDLLISDIGLPDGDGHEIMRYVRQKHAFPGIAVSGYGMEEDLETARRAGFSNHLTKPVHPDALLEAVADAIRTHSGAQQP